MAWAPNKYHVINVVPKVPKVPKVNSVCLLVIADRGGRTYRKLLIGTTVGALGTPLILKGRGFRPWAHLSWNN